MRYFLGIIFFIAGLAMVVYRERVKRTVGDIAWFEKYFGPGGTYTGLLIIGLCMSVGSVLVMTGTVQSIFKKIFGPIFGI